MELTEYLIQEPARISIAKQLMPTQTLVKIYNHREMSSMLIILGELCFQASPT